MHAIRQGYNTGTIVTIHSKKSPIFSKSHRISKHKKERVHFYYSGSVFNKIQVYNIMGWLIIGDSLVHLTGRPLVTIEPLKIKWKP